MLRFKYLLSIAVVIFVPQVGATTAFNLSTNVLSLDSVAYNGTRYKNVSVRVDSYTVLGVSSEDSIGEITTAFDPSTQVLTLGRVVVGDTTYRNASVRLGSFAVLDVGASEPLAQVVVVGYSLANVPGSPPKGQMWVNGSEKALPVGPKRAESLATAVSFVGNTPVVAGYLPFEGFTTSDFYDVPKLWYDGVTPGALLTATDFLGSHVPSAIQGTSNGEVHVAGTATRGGLKKIVYWKNGQAQYWSTLDDNRTYESGLSMAVTEEGVVHICGFENVVPQFPACWRNGVKSSLSSRPGAVLGVATRSFDVYAAGQLQFVGGEAYQAVVWKNGAVTPLGDKATTTPSSAMAVTTDGLSDVYVVGSRNQKSNNSNDFQRAVLWKNGVEQVLEGANANSLATAVKVVGNDVYVAGHVSGSSGKKQQAALWVNGKLQLLSDGTLLSWASGLAVK